MQARRDQGGDRAGPQVPAIDLAQRPDDRGREATVGEVHAHKGVGETLHREPHRKGLHGKSGKRPLRVRVHCVSGSKM